MRYNLKYARLNGDKLVYAPNILVMGDEQIINAPPEVYASRGWLPVIKTNSPQAEDGYYYEPYYSESDGAIVQRWEKHEIPDVATEDDYINALEDLGVNFNE